MLLRNRAGLEWVGFPLSEWVVAKKESYCWPRELSENFRKRLHRFVKERVIEYLSYGASGRLSGRFDLARQRLDQLPDLIREDTWE